MPERYIYSAIKLNPRRKIINLLTEEPLNPERMDVRRLKPNSNNTRSLRLPID
jgi:hypothetical protein